MQEFTFLIVNFIFYFSNKKFPRFYVLSTSNTETEIVISFKIQAIKLTCSDYQNINTQETTYSSIND